MRREAIRRRKEAAARLGDVAGPALARRVSLLPLRPGCVVGAYWPIPGEIDPRPLMAAVTAAGGRLALPVVVAPAAPLLFRAWDHGVALEAGPHGTCHPPAAAAVLRPDLLLVPLLAYDAKGFRLGHGGGYYDRTLAALRQTGGVVAVGLAFSVQGVSSLPVEGWDERLDMILTERGLVGLEHA